MILRRLWKWVRGREREVLLAYRYEAGCCPNPGCVGSLAWIPEAPGSREGKHCNRCHGIFTATYHVPGTRKVSFFNRSRYGDLAVVRLDDGFEKVVSRRTDVYCRCDWKFAPIDIGD